MSDNNSPSKDFSQGPSSYSKTSVTINGIPSQEQAEGAALSPSNLFSNRPAATPGSFTFGVKNKGGKETIIENSWNRVPSVGAEISRKQEELDTLNLGKMTQEAGIQITKNKAGELEVYIPPELENEPQAPSIDFQKLLPLISEFVLLKKRAEDLYPKDIDQSIKANVLTMVSTLSWLTENPAKHGDVIPDDVEQHIASLLATIKKGEAELSTKKDALTKTEEAARDNEKQTLLKQREEERRVLTILKDLIPLAEEFAKATKDTDTILLSLKDGAEKQKLAAELQKLEILKKNVEASPSQDTFTTFEESLKLYSIHIDEASTGVKKTLESNASDLWGGWPSSLRLISIKANKNQNQRAENYWELSQQGTNRKLPDPALWSTIKENFDKEFSLYKSFFDSGDTVAKAKTYPNLITSKNDIIAALKEGDSDKAKTLINVLRTSLFDTKKIWDESVEKEKKVAEKNKERIESKKKIKDILLESDKKITKHYETVLQEIRSEDEKNFLAKMFSELTKLKNTLDQEIADVTKDVQVSSKEAYEKAFASLTEVLTKIDKHQDELRWFKGVKVLRPERPPRAKDGQMIRLRKPILKDGVLKHEITVGEWRQNQEGAKQAMTESKNEGSLRDFFSLKAMHEEMLARDPEEYVKTYVRKDWVEGDMGKRASEEAIANYVAKAKEEYDRTLEEKLALDILISRNELPEEGHAPGGKQLQLTQTMERILKNLERIDKPSYEEKLRKFNDMLAKDRSLRSNREVYSPAQDESIAYMTVGGGAPSGWREKAKFIRANKANSSRIADRKSRMEGGVGSYIASEALLSKKTVPNHYEGMTTSFTQEEARKVEGSYPAPEHALIYEDIETPLQKPTDIEETFIPKRPDTPETLREKMSRVKKLYETFDTNYKKKYGNNWKAWAVAIPLFTYGVTEVVRSIDVSKKPETLGQAMAEMSWQEEFVQSKEDREFLKDFASTSELGFVGNMKKYAPSNILDENNLSTIKGISDLKCIDLFDASKPTVEGLTNTQRKELCSFVQRLERMMGYAQGKDRRDTTTFREHAYKDYSDEPTMTLQKYYDIVRRVVEEQNNKEAALRKNN